MLTHPNFDPVAISLGPLDIHWYGLMYLLGFAAAWRIALRNSKRPWSPVDANHVETLIVYAAWGVILGGRLGYILFYDFSRWLEDPLMLVRIWEGGMSFHGGLLGVALALALYARHNQKSFFSITDFAVPLAPLGLFFGRIGNFIGQELWGRPTDVPWAMLFPNDPLNEYRHPSQLYEAFLEGIVLFFVVNWFARKPRTDGQISGLFLLGYGVFRFAVEFVREPDNHIKFDLFDWMTRGQILCIPMILLGLWLLRGLVFNRSTVKA